MVVNKVNVVVRWKTLKTPWASGKEIANCDSLRFTGNYIFMIEFHDSIFHIVEIIGSYFNALWYM